MSALSDAAASGDRLNALRALRDELARSIPQEEMGGAKAALSKQLADVLIQIDTLAPPKKASNALDELADRRASRGASAPRKDRPAR